MNKNVSINNVKLVTDAEKKTKKKKRFNMCLRSIWVTSGRSVLT